MGGQIWEGRAAVGGQVWEGRAGVEDRCGRAGVGGPVWEGRAGSTEGGAGVASSLRPTGLPGPWPASPWLRAPVLDNFINSPTLGFHL